MNNRVSERRIRNNRKKRNRQLKRQFIAVLFGMMLTVVISGTFFGMKSKAQTADEAQSLQYKYYTSITVAAGDTLLQYASEYADDHYDSVDDYVKEVMDINHLKSSESIKYGQKLIIPYYSEEFVQ